MNPILYLTLLFLFSAAALSDTGEGKIPNRLTGFGLAAYLLCRTAGILSAFLSGEEAGFGSSGAVIFGECPSPVGLMFTAFCCFLTLIFWKFRLLGGGDVKLFWLLFLFLPGSPGICCFLFSFLIAFPAAVYGLVTGARKIRLGGAMLLSFIIYAGWEAGLP